MKLYVNSDSMSAIATFLTTVSGETTATFTEDDIMTKDYSDAMMDTIYGFKEEWSSATSTRKKEIVAILNAYYTSPSAITADDVMKEYSEQLKTAYDASYFNPANYSTEQDRVDALIHEGMPVVYPD